MPVEYLIQWTTHLILHFEEYSGYFIKKRFPFESRRIHLSSTSFQRHHQDLCIIAHSLRPQDQPPSFGTLSFAFSLKFKLAQSGASSEESRVHVLVERELREFVCTLDTDCIS